MTWKSPGKISKFDRVIDRIEALKKKTMYMRKASSTNKNKKKKGRALGNFQEKKYNHFIPFGSLVNDICYCSPILI